MVRPKNEATLISPMGERYQAVCNFTSFGGRLQNSLGVKLTLMSHFVFQPLNLCSLSSLLGMLTISDFINILRHHYKSPIVRNYQGFVQEGGGGGMSLSLSVVHGVDMFFLGVVKQKFRSMDFPEASSFLWDIWDMPSHCAVKHNAIFFLQEKLLTFMPSLM